MARPGRELSRGRLGVVGEQAGRRQLRAAARVRAAEASATTRRPATTRVTTDKTRRCTAKAARRTRAEARAAARAAARQQQWSSSGGGSGGGSGSSSGGGDDHAPEHWEIRRGAHSSSSAWPAYFTRSASRACAPTRTSAATRRSAPARRLPAAFRSAGRFMAPARPDPDLAGATFRLMQAAAVADDRSIPWLKQILFPLHVAAVVGVWMLGWSWRGFAIAVAFYYAIRMLFVTSGYHRYLHRELPDEPRRCSSPSSRCWR